MTQNGSKNLNSLFEAFKTMLPLMTGILPTAAAYAILASNAGMKGYNIILSSLIVFAGSVQFISIELIRQGLGYIQFGLIVFLLHARHMFFGISLFEKFKKTGKLKPLMIFWLTDETYAVLTSKDGELPKNTKEGLYYIFAAMMMYLSWNFGTALGVFASGFIKFNTEGMDFALSAMFLVVVTEQMKSYKSKLPFVIGGFWAVASLIVFGPSGMLLGCCTLSVISLMALRKHIDDTLEGTG